MGYGRHYVYIYQYISAASPNRAPVGATSDLAQMIVSVMRAGGPNPRSQ